MTVPEDVNPLHRSYMELSTRYRAAWTYHRFIQGLRKFFGNQSLADYPADFQALYRSLKEVSRKLNDPDSQAQIESLSSIKVDLDRLLEVLEEEDGKMEPSLLRLFFQRVKSPDERILLDLVRFYQEIQADRSWEPERVDKVDFLLTRLGELIIGADRSGDKKRLARILEGVASGQETVELEVDPQRLANRQTMLQAARNEIRQARDFEDLTDRDLLNHYREVKHGLGRALLDRTILPLVVDTNLVVGARIRELSEVEENRLLADYERVSELEESGRIGRRLAGAVTALHQQVEEFQKRVQSGDIRMADLSSLRSSVQHILVRLESGDAAEASDLPLALDDDDGVAASGPSVGSVLTSRSERGLVGSDLRELLTGLHNARATGESAGSASELLHYRLEQREALAYSRLCDGDDCDERLERFLLAAAALRRRINREVVELQDVRGQTGAAEFSISEETAGVLRLSDWYLRQFSHFRENHLLAGEMVRASNLGRLRMRLMRDHAGLWLMANPVRENL